MFRKTIYLFLLFLFLASCKTMSSVKRGLSGEKINNTDEFLVEKKDPLILPPDFENLPIPGNESEEEVEEVNIFKDTSTNETISSSSSTEESILNKIRTK
jgi:hypothetical protein